MYVCACMRVCLCVSGRLKRGVCWTTRGPKNVLEFGPVHKQHTKHVYI